MLGWHTKQRKLLWWEFFGIFVLSFHLLQILKWRKFMLEYFGSYYKFKLINYLAFDPVVHAWTKTISEIHKDWAHCQTKIFKENFETKVLGPRWRIGNTCLSPLRSGADFIKGVKPRLRLKFKTLVLHFVNRMVSLWS